MTYLLQFGHTPTLSRAELNQYLVARKIKYSRTDINDTTSLIVVKKSLSLGELVASLGGVIRAVEFFARRDTLDQVIEQISWQLIKKMQTRVDFGLSFIGGELDPQEYLLKIKHHLKEHGISSRFVVSKTDYIQPIVLRTQKVIEIVVVDVQGVYYAGETMAVTDVIAWQQRDRQRPNVDAKSGVLPPKTARMMCNLALVSPQPNQNILDPFCGSGTILMEALLMGHNSYGIDLSAVAVEDTRANLKWLESQTELSSKWKVLQADASSVSWESLVWPKFDAVISETYLGPSNFQWQDIPKIISDLKNLYSDSLTNLKTFLKPKARIVMAFPNFVNHSASRELHKFLIDTSQESGYTLPIKPLDYGQVGARIKRKIYTFQIK